MNIAIFASGRGSNFQAILDAMDSGALPKIQVVYFFSDRADCPAVKIAESKKIPLRTLSLEEIRDRQKFETELSQTLREHFVDLIVLAGYMRIVGKNLLKDWEGKIINLHPSLLPHFPGKNAIEESYLAKSRFAGVTVHYVDEGVDTGGVIRQVPVPIGDLSLGEFEQKIHEAEHQLLPQVIDTIRQNFEKSKNPD